MLDIQRELADKGYYDGAVDGIVGPRAIQAIRNFEKANGLKVTGEPSETLLEKIRHGLSKSDITGSVAPAAPAIMGSRIGSVQRMLARYGFGPVRINGELDADTRAAIQRFESERSLQPTGQVTDRLVRELAEYSGHTPD
jgi:peptidoglycan hydrolase-like protein with peptidoglycan-binding domain